MATLTFDHWQKGRVTREVKPYGSDWENVASHLIYKIGPFTNAVFNAGHTTRGYSAPLEIGTNGHITEENQNG